MGAAGTGKSKMIHALLRQIQREVLGRVIVTGYTGVSCSPFLTPTIMKLFNLSMKLSDRNPRATELEKLRTRFKTVAGFDVNALKGLVIDEVSFIQPELLGRVSRLLKAIRGAFAVPTSVS
jgi:MoxR-like ATPase